MDPDDHDTDDRDTSSEEDPERDELSESDSGDEPKRDGTAEEADAPLTVQPLTTPATFLIFLCFQRMKINPRQLIYTNFKYRYLLATARKIPRFPSSLVKKCLGSFRKAWE
ncbi:hypothetical protein N7466_003991 [Penicillium verhagenii]|uniref:uncharacterized protein n=1 Tax=Penicillium verhagenii TaxID=1562060 RepID=UPI0025454925|nr:uncharacterized protein N7466_003991 [Penicillium verhagenii]KAJ5934444.1 hypothetical protein N7466_003991 [Penicillium verhagenii]